MNTTKISMRGRYPCPRLFARLVWQELFNCYRNNGGDLGHMDNMLCDLYTLTREFERYKSFTVWWDFWRDTTNIKKYLDPTEENVYEVHWDIDAYEVTITQITQEMSKL